MNQGHARLSFVSTLVLSLIIAAVSATGARAATVTFESGDLAQFSLSGTAGAHYSINPTAGVGGGSGLVIAPTSGGAFLGTAYSSIPFNQASTLSIDYKQGSDNFGIDAIFGLFSSNTLTNLFGGAPDSVWVTAYPVNVNTNHEADLMISDNNGNIGRGVSGFSPTFGNWYRLELSFTRQIIPVNSEVLNATVSRYDLGPTGTSTPTLVVQHSDVTPVSGLFSLPVYAGFAGTQFQGAYDNFSVAVAPEPASVLSLAAFAGALSLRRHRRSH